jgi:capsular polysaccharide biosynthesis protein
VELRRYVSILRRRVPLIAVTVVLAIAIAWVRTPKTAYYTANSTIYVGYRQFTTAQGGLSSDVLSGVGRLTATFAQMIHSEPIATDAVERSGIQRSASAVVGATAVGAVEGTQLLRLQVTDQNPVVARDLANAISDAFVEKVQHFEPTAPAGEGTVPSLPAYVFEKAKLPTSPAPIGLARNVAVAGLFGLLATASVAFLLEYLDVTIKNPGDAERRLELPVLGVIPFQRQRMVQGSPPSLGFSDTRA